MMLNPLLGSIASHFPSHFENISDRFLLSRCGELLCNHQVSFCSLKDLRILERFGFDDAVDEELQWIRRKGSGRVGEPGLKSVWPLFVVNWGWFDEGRRAGGVAEEGLRVARFDLRPLLFETLGVGRGTPGLLVFKNLLEVLGLLPESTDFLLALEVFLFESLGSRSHDGRYQRQAIECCFIAFPVSGG